MARYFLSLFLMISAIQAGLTQDFPQSWEGKWKGNLEIHTGKGLMQTIPMELHILPTADSARHTFTIIYGAGEEASPRNYLLETVNPEIGLYRIDEQNSIKMEAYLLGNKLVQIFEVEGQRLISTTEKTGKKTMIWEILAGPADPISVTGNTEIDGEQIPPVNTFPVQVMQRANLRKL